MSNRDYANSQLWDSGEDIPPYMPVEMTAPPENPVGLSELRYLCLYKSEPPILCVNAGMRVYHSGALARCK